MESFSYTIKDEVGIHARPAGALVKLVAGLSSNIKIEKGEKSADAKKLFAILSLSIKYNDEIVISAEGENEKSDIEKVRAFFEENL